ncbi:hypothetical protein CSB45_08590 [candidate division KSB3 bacterium]|uniref:Uncharacterized protein n=1 Tax=candidate division KSB3 bacterium TaxID=2044937 RepID=A0A2G6E679_9BACT|nr:MAG: hypothetical protein CSB45_08590 [candidate division KSB3 bacterium]PIE29727.1 MAG: hypothetical protein CSA57_06625 [candidate division KSB3 bacterium]
MSDTNSNQSMYNKATGMYLKALVEMMKALDMQTEIRIEINGKLLKRAMDDGFLCALSNDFRRSLWNYCYDHEILLARGPFRKAKATRNCIGWAFPYHAEEDKQRVHRILAGAGMQRTNRERKNFRKFFNGIRSALPVLRVEIPPNIVKINLTNAFYQTAVEVLSTVNLDTQQLYGSVVDAVSPANYCLPDDYTPNAVPMGRMDSNVST